MRESSSQRPGRFRRARHAAALLLLLARPATAADDPARDTAGGAAQAPDRAAQMRAHRGGTMRLLAHAAAGTLDPHINYTGQFWQFFAVTHDGLVTFRKVPGEAGNTVIADLAESIPEPTDAGRTYLFHLRRGIRFSDGREVTPSDVAASFRRIFRVLGPTAGTFYNGIVGADACLKAPADCRLEGVAADDAAGTVTIRLVRADSEFLMKLALPHATVLPADAPPRDVGTAPLPATGPYRVVSYEPNRSLRLERNPYFREWNAEAQPDGFPDAVEYRFGLEAEAEVTEVQNNQADWMFDQPPSDRLAELGARFAPQVHLHPALALIYLPMNVRVPPFDDVRVRRAVNFAVDRRAIAKLAGGRNLAAPTCQVLPPGIVGHEPYCPYTRDPGEHWSAPDMARARELVAASGTAGQQVTLVVDDSAIGRNVGTYVVSVLRDLGYQARLRSLSANIQFPFIQNSANRVQIGLTSWYADYPAPSDFLGVLFSCSAFHPNSDSSINISAFCDEKLDEDMQRANDLAATDTAASAHAWAAVDRAVTDLAPAAVLYTPRYINFVGARIGNFRYNDVYHWLVTQSWVR